MEVLAIIFSLALLTYIAYKGFTVILFAPVCALSAILIAGYPLMPAYTEIFMPAAAGYVRSFFPVFLLGAVFGKVMEDSGAAASIARAIALKLGPDKAIMATVFTCMLLTYGGISLFVVAFAAYPFAAALFRQANMPKRLIPGTIATGAFGCTMTSIPGTPQIQNVIPTKYFGTDLYAAPIFGLLGAILMVALAIIWLNYRKNKMIAAGEGYGTGHKNEPNIDPNADLPNPYLSVIPLLSVLICNYVFTKWIPSWDPNIFAQSKSTATLQSVLANWALIISLVIGILMSIAFGWKQLRAMEGKSTKLQIALNAGAIGSLLAIMNTASEVGYGNIIRSLPGFQVVVDFMGSIDPLGTPLVSESIAVNALAGITGSASGGMSIALEAMGAHYLKWANEVGVSPELLHRVASMSSGGFDTMPHNGAVITLLAICGLTHKESYPDIGMCSLVIPFLSTFVVIILGTLIGGF